MIKDSKSKTIAMFLALLMACNLFLFATTPQASAVAVLDPAVSDNTGYDPYELRFESGTFVPSTVENTIRFYTSNGQLIVSDTAASVPDGTDYVIEGIYPLLATGSYYLTVTNQQGTTSGQVSFTVGGGYIEPSIWGVISMSGLLDFPAATEEVADLFFPDPQYNHMISIITDPITYGPVVYTVKAGSQTLTPIDESYGAVVAVPPGLHGNRTISVMVNNLSFGSIDMEILDPNQYQITSSYGSSLVPGNSYNISWTGGEVAAILLMKGEEIVESEDGSWMYYVTGSDDQPVQVASPYTWTVPEFLQAGSDYRFMMIFISDQTMEAIQSLTDDLAGFKNIGLSYHFEFSPTTFSIGSGGQQYIEPLDDTEPIDYGQAGKNSEPANLTDWTTDQSHPIGTLINENGTIYQITEAGRVGFPSVPVFRSYGHTFNDVVLASEGDKKLPVVKDLTYADGDLLVDNGTVYIMYQGKKYMFSSQQAFQNLGYSFQNVFQADMSNIVLGGTISDGNQAHTFGTVVNDNGTFYTVVPEGRIGISSWEVFRAHKYRLERVVMANDADRALPVLDKLDFPAGTLLNVNGTVYYLTSERLLHFDRPDEFQSIGYRFENVINGNYRDYDRWMLPRSTHRSMEYILEAEHTSTYTQRDHARLARVRKIWGALTQYFTDNQDYPDSLAQLSPQYLPTLPQAPEPADGQCTAEQNGFGYFKSGKGSFQLTFCLGSETHGYQPGQKVLTPAGVE